MGISSKLLNEGETVVLHTRTHAKALLLPLLALIVLIAVGEVGHFWLPRVASLVLWVIVAIGVVWLVLRPVLEWATATYTVTTRRLITRRGVLTRRGHDIPLSRISDVAYEFDLIDRLLGCGTLIVSDASTHGRVVLHDIPHAEESQRRINDLLHSLPGDGRAEGV
ncbi:membrane protein YdbS, contains bPH2 (pleckstrin homology) domain [Nocardioides terrae]|uniref:Membrane protein YdbS, contains bPH2 (Pleckstrin homology) domain n=1 Tax=Nocardioides terrae TaxID=574651 RepID=A0A1I1DMM0_9ACTN|nr:PH domain-containing protein [Nocardioides terrae]SFB76087.1 membrane protein YdbS, contains bPH2 (pleckstrin homology) domain [Nocardioides terrae]